MEGRSSETRLWQPSIVISDCGSRGQVLLFFLPKFISRISELQHGNKGQGVVFQRNISYSLIARGGRARRRGGRASASAPSWSGGPGGAPAPRARPPRPAASPWGAGSSWDRDIPAFGHCHSGGLRPVVAFKMIAGTYERHVCLLLPVYLLGREY